MELPCRVRVNYRGYAVAVHRRLCYRFELRAPVVGQQLDQARPDLIVKHDLRLQAALGRRRPASVGSNVTSATVTARPRPELSKTRRDSRPPSPPTHAVSCAGTSDARSPRCGAAGAAGES